MSECGREVNKTLDVRIKGGTWGAEMYMEMGVREDRESAGNDPKLSTR